LIAYNILTLITDFFYRALVFMFLMVFDKLNQKSSLFRRFLYYPLIAGLISFSGCSKDNSGPITPNNPGGGNGGGNDDEEYVEDSGRTNDYGDLKLEVDEQKFDIHITNESGSSLDDIVVNGDYFGRGIYGFSFEDFSHNYFSSVKYVDINETASTNGIDGFSINESMNRLRGRKYEKRFHDKNEDYPYDLSQNDNLNPLGTIPIDELHDFYVEHDALFRNVSTLEFMRDLTGSPELSFALEAAKFRETFIENLNNYNDIVNTVASLFGGSFEKEAYYIDVYENTLNVLTHQTSTKHNYVTLKGKVYNNNDLSRIGGTFINITRGPVIKSVYSDNNGTYFIKKLIEGMYDITGSHSGFDNDNTGKRLSFFGYVQPRCESLDFYLTPQHQNTLDTLILQPGPEGKDAYVSQRNRDSNYGNSSMLYYINDEGPLSYPYLSFDLSLIETNKPIELALFSIYGQANFYQGDQIVELSINRIGEDWGENVITWDSDRPRVYELDYAVSTPSYSKNLVEFDITQLVKEWVNGIYPNYGIFVGSASYISSGEYGFSFYSSDHLESLRRPKLTIIYEH
ncbi:MAG: DNRLRE domain-containing protein, partial [Nanoarchaeota archaeon]